VWIQNKNGNAIRGKDGNDQINLICDYRVRFCQRQRISFRRSGNYLDLIAMNLVAGNELFGLKPNLVVESSSIGLRVKPVTRNSLDKPRFF
jgi:hypothetical protein